MRKIEEGGNMRSDRLWTTMVQTITYPKRSPTWATLPFFFWINDLFNSSPLMNFIPLADEARVLFSRKSLDFLSVAVNLELTAVTDWFMANRGLCYVSISQKTMFSK